ncbi:MAG: hypothetical protein AAFY45_27305 [Bacteroidota bacterium]
MKNVSKLLCVIILFATSNVFAQSEKLPIYGHVAIGYGNTFFYGTLAEKETINDGRGFGRNQGNTLSTFFYVSPEKWNGLGIGSGVKGFFATPNNGGNNETYLFNYYHVGVGLKYHPFSNQFNKGFYTKVNFGFGQMTEKMRYNDENRYEHQFAIGTTILGGLGYAFPIGKSQKAAINIDLEAEYSSRRGDVTGLGEDQQFQNSHISINFGLSF